MSTDAPIRKGRALTLSTSGAPVDLELTRIRRDGGTQPRAGIDPAHLARLVEALEAGEILPSVIVFHDGADHWLADGFHRVAAFEQRGSAFVNADIRQGTRRDAVLHSVGANRSHGLPRSRDDLWRAIETLLRDEEWGQWSDREIARQVGCSHHTVGSVRSRLASTGQIAQSTTRMSGDGRERPATQPARDKLQIGSQISLLEARVAPAPFDVAHWERRAYAIGANLKGYGQHWELVEPDGTKSRYPNGCEDQLARRIAQLDQRKATTAASVVAGDLDAQTERAYQHLETELADDLARLGTEGSRRLAVLLLGDDAADSESLWEALTSTARERPDLIHVLGERR